MISLRWYNNTSFSTGGNSMIPFLVHLAFGLLMDYPSLCTHSNSWVHFLLIYFCKSPFDNFFLQLGDFIQGNKSIDDLLLWQAIKHDIKQAILSSPWIVQKKQLPIANPLHFRVNPKDKLPIKTLQTKKFATNDSL